MISVTLQFVVYEKVLKEFIWLPISLKCTYFIGNTSKKNSRFKRTWFEVVDEWMTYPEVIRGIMWVRTKHGKISCGDCRVSRHGFCGNQNSHCRFPFKLGN